MPRDQISFDVMSASRCCGHNKGRHWNVTPKLILCKDCPCARKTPIYINNRNATSQNVRPKLLADLKAEAKATMRDRIFATGSFKKLLHSPSVRLTACSGRSLRIQKFRRGGRDD